MLAGMVPAASFLVLLCLPPKSCLPREWPRPAPVAASARWEPEGAPGAAQQPPCSPPPPAPLPRPRQQRSAPAGRRRDGRPNSLDLTFHLLREFLEMSREERLAQKARSNRLLLHSIGK